MSFEDFVELSVGGSAHVLGERFSETGWSKHVLCTVFSNCQDARKYVLGTFVQEKTFEQFVEVLVPVGMVEGRRIAPCQCVGPESGPGLANRA